MSDKLEPLPPDRHDVPDIKSPSYEDLKGTHMPDVKETIDLIEALETLAVEIVQRVKDGVSPADAVSLVLDGDVREDLMAAYKDSSDVPGEVADLDLDELEQLIDAAKRIPFSVLRELRR